jgi:hypothetical protein
MDRYRSAHAAEWASVGTRTASGDHPANHEHDQDEYHGEDRAEPPIHNDLARVGRSTACRDGSGILLSVASERKAGGP